MSQTTSVCLVQPICRTLHIPERCMLICCALLLGLSLPECILSSLADKPCMPLLLGLSLPECILSSLADKPCMPLLLGLSLPECILSSLADKPCMPLLLGLILLLLCSQEEDESTGHVNPRPQSTIEHIQSRCVSLSRPKSRTELAHFGDTVRVVDPSNKGRFGRSDAIGCSRMQLGFLVGLRWIGLDSIGWVGSDGAVSLSRIYSHADSLHVSLLESAVVARGCINELVGARTPYGGTSRTVEPEGECGLTWAQQSSLRPQSACDTSKRHRRWDQLKSRHNHNAGNVEDSRQRQQDHDDKMSLWKVAPCPADTVNAADIWLKLCCLILVALFDGLWIGRSTERQFNE